MALIGPKFWVAAAPVSRTLSFDVVGGPAVSCVISDVILNERVSLALACEFGPSLI
jgi:hypothetical protein